MTEKQKKNANETAVILRTDQEGELKGPLFSVFYSSSHINMSVSEKSCCCCF